ncbi:MAG: hypothetical protein ACLTYW_09985 [Collinsella sp.]
MLCDRAMIRRTTFYKHFRDKNDYFAFISMSSCRACRKNSPMRPARYLPRTCARFARDFGRCHGFDSGARAAHG